MTTLAVDAPRVYELGDTSYHPAINADIVYEGSAVGDSSGYGRPLVAGDKFLGFAKTRCDNSTGAAGDKNIELLTRGEIALTVSGAALTDVGRAVYASDDNTFTFTKGDNSFVGYVKRYSSTLSQPIVAFDATRVISPSRLKVGYTIGTQSGNNITVAVQLYYETGQECAERRGVLMYLSDNANGDTQGAPANGTDIAAATGTNGLVIENVSNNSFLAISESNGDIDITLTKVSTGIETVYLVTVLPDGSLDVSGAITFA